MCRSAPQAVSPEIAVRTGIVPSLTREGSLVYRDAVKSTRLRRGDPLRRFVDSRARVRYKDTDLMGIAHHSNYIVWFEIGRTDLCREAGLDYRSIEEKGWVLVVTEISCRYRTPYRYDDEVLIRTFLADGGSRLMRFGYELLDGSGATVHAEGYSSHVWLEKSTRRPAVAPPELVGIFEPYWPR